MRTRIALATLVLSLSIGGVSLTAQEMPQPQISDWPAPAFWQSPPSHTSADHARAVQGAISSPLPFVPITPCRMLDTRTSGGVIASGSTRNVTLTGPPCGIPSNAAAVSANFAVFNIITSGNGVLTVYPTGSPSSSQAMVNWSPTSGQIDNASAVPLGTAGAITVQPNQGGGTIDLVIDVNGYYAGAGAALFNTFLGQDAGNFTMTGDFNTAVGVATLTNNTSGPSNTAIGFASLFRNTTGDGNTGVGRDTLAFSTTGGSNTAVGLSALNNNTTAPANTAVGAFALTKNTTGDINTAVGFAALNNNITGRGNVAIGFGAGDKVTGDGNICIGNEGAAGESNTVRIAPLGATVAVFIGGIRGKTTGNANAVPVLIDSLGQLGTVSSSARLKEEIADMADASSGLLKLRPVTFRYKAQAGSRKQFGLIAEEVEKTLPELVVHSESGEVETVLYHEMPAMLLNELQKQHRTNEAQERNIERQKRIIEALEARLAKLEAQLAESR